MVGQLFLTAISARHLPAKIPGPWPAGHGPRALKRGTCVRESLSGVRIRGPSPRAVVVHGAGAMVSMVGDDTIRPKYFFGAAERLWHMRREKILTRRIRAHPLRNPQISHGGCHMVARRNNFPKHYYKSLFINNNWLRTLDFNQRPSGYEFDVRNYL